MIPITRKEYYLNRIVGNNNYETPEKPITTEEFFFAEILGEAVQAPEPLTRYQMYLANIAGRNIEIPYPETRIEYFLARAAGMDVETPVPITREEIYWSNYTAIVEFELEGVPPLTYKAIEGTLKNYRIYGQTSRNLFDGEILQGFYSFSNGIYYGSYGSYQHYVCTNKIECKSNTTYTIQVYAPKIISYSYGFIWWDENLNFISAYTSTKPQSSDITTVSATAPNNAKYMAFDLGANSAESPIVPSNVSWIMLNEGSAPLPYEPYGELVGDLVTSGEHAGEYKVPVTVSDGTNSQTIPIYLPEQIKKVGDEAEYIDYEEQKLHRVGAEDIDVTLPELPTLAETNVLTVGTAVQPSKVYVKYKGERQ